MDFFLKKAQVPLQFVYVFLKTGKKVSKNKQKFTEIDNKFQFLREFLQVFEDFFPFLKGVFP
jgi:hypothetical protein